MAILTAQAITREAGAILHEKLDFIHSINRQHDKRFAQAGAKIGTTLQIRLPNEYVTRTGSTWTDQDHDEKAETLVVATQKGVDSSISSLDLTMSMDDFRERVLEPQMSVLASIIEDDALSMTYDVANAVGTPGTIPGSTSGQALKPWLQAKQRLGQNLAPGPYRAQIDGDASTETINGLSSLYNDQRSIAKQYTDGFLLRNSGIEYFLNQKVKRLTLGSRANATVDGANQGEDGTIVLASAGVSATIKKGEIFTIADVYDVHPETKTAYANLKQFVVTAAATSAADESVTLSISPTIVPSGARQNVNAAAVTGATVTFAGTASTAYANNLVYAKDAFAFVAAELDIPKGMDMAAQEVIDKLPIRFVRWFDGDNDKWKSRFDVLYGYKTIRQQIACRIWGA